MDSESRQKNIIIVYQFYYENLESLVTFHSQYSNIQKAKYNQKHCI